MDGKLDAAMRFDAEVRCLDGRCGRLARIVLDPQTRAVTHLVIRLQDGRDVVLPMAWVGAATGEALSLKVASDELRDLPDFISTDFCLPSVDLAHPYGEGCALIRLPDLGVFDPGVLPIEHRAIPPGEVALKEGMPVLCSDGSCGRIGEVLLDPDHVHASAFVVRKGFLFARDVTVPLSWVSDVDDDGVHLKASRDQLTKLGRNWP